jgi:Lsr2
MKLGAHPSAVRAWAAAHAVRVSDRGRIPASVVAQFEAAGN